MKAARILGFAFVSVLATAAACRGEDAAVTIVIGKEAPPLERLAAEEIGETIDKVFHRKSQILDAVPDKEGPAILVGSPRSNAPLKAALGDAWPKLSDQGHLLKTTKLKGREVLVVGGQTPVATYWGASELAHRWGVRSLLTGNYLPFEPPPFSLEGFDEVLEPSFKVRAWTLMDGTPVGPAAWSLAEQKRIIRQLARMKFTRVVLDLEPWQPFVSFEFNGVKKTSTLLWPGGPIKVDGDTAGRAVFQGKTEFDNPDFVGKKTPEERFEAGKQLLSGIIDEAHRYGLTATIAVSPFDFPKEFQSQLPDSEPSVENGDLAVIPGPKAPLYDEPVQKLAIAQLKALIATYPTMDTLVIGLPLDMHGDAEAAWKRLQATGTLPETALYEDLLKGAKARKGLLSGDEGIALISGQVAAIPAVRRLVEHPDVSRRANGKLLDVELIGVDPLLARLGLRVTPTGTCSLFVSDPLPAPAPGSSLPLKITGGMDWSDMIVGVTPRFHFQETARSFKELRTAGWSGFTAMSSNLGGSDPTAYFASRAAFDSQLTPEACVRDLIDQVAGEGVADRVVKAFRLVDEAADAVNLADIPVVVPDARLYARYLTGGAAPEWWATLKDAHLKAMDEMYRANTRARDGGRELTLYFARRFEAAYEMMNAIDTVREGNAAAARGEKEKHVESIEKAIESTYASLNAYAAIARDSSDRGTIALVNRAGYRVLQKMLEDADK
ncbi:MAG: hypothetical protein IT428_11835 [Planctomycetaceae bacterium]|nr:hypothetical protein [Planctomycetaceae bacterium]